MTNLQTFFPYSTLYISGLNISFATTTTLTVTPGLCRDSTNSYDIVVPSSRGNFTINGAVNGVNGLDTGSLAASTWYAIYLISDFTNKNLPVTLISTSATTPVLPEGYNMFRRIGWTRTDGSVHFLKFYQSGNANGRLYQWDAVIAVLTGGSSATFAAVSLAAGAPPQASPVYLLTAYTPASAANTMSMRPTGSAATAGTTPVVIKASAAAQLILPSIKILPQLSSSNASVDYVVTASDALTLSVSAFEDVV